MSVFDKFFERYSYRFPKGYPDFTNKQDILILENIFNEINLFEANTAEGNKFVVDIINQNSEKLGFELDRLNDESSPNKLYFKGVPNSGKNSRPIRIDILKNISSLFSDNEFIDLKKESPEFTVVIDGQKHRFGIKGAGSDYSTETLEKEGLVIFFYNSPLKELFTPESLLENGGNILNGKYYRGINTKPERVETLLNKYTSNLEKAANDRVALDTLNDPLSSAIAIKKAYGNDSPLITGAGTFEDVRTTGVELAGLDDKDKWNPGDVYLQLADIKYSKAKALSDPDTIEPVTEYNKNFVNIWGKKTNIDDVPTSFVSISLKNKNAAAGKGKGFLKGFDPASEYGKIKRGVTGYNMTDEEKKWSDDKLSSEITKLKQEIEGEIIGRGKGIKYNPGPTPSKRSQLLAKYASLKILKFILIEVSQGGGLEIDKALASIASYAASLTGVNPTFFKVSGDPKGEAEVIRFPAESSAELTKGKEIEIIDKGTAGSIQIIISITSLDPRSDDTKEFDFIMNIRSNGTGQNTIELNIAK
tara:strand:- start:344 stop:1939 length:1596 start_codon:yes stop_codon:yes gene_type:complete